MADSKFNIGDKVMSGFYEDVRVVCGVDSNLVHGYTYDILYTEVGILRGIPEDMLEGASGLKLVKWYLDLYEFDSTFVDDHLDVEGLIVVLENDGSFELEWEQSEGVLMSGTRINEISTARTVVAVLEGM